MHLGLHLLASEDLLNDALFIDDERGAAASLSSTATRTTGAEEVNITFE